MLGVGLSLTERRRSAFAPAALFSAGEVGAWYDPSDLTTLFQDAAGTTPVTAAGQVVGRINDKSGRGNHAFQSGATSVRPIYAVEPATGRRNLLTYSEDFSNSAWVKSLTTVSGTQTVTYAGGLGSPLIRLIENRTTIAGGNSGKTFTFSAIVSGSGKIRLKNTQNGVADNFSADITLSSTPTLVSLTVTNAVGGSGVQTGGFVASTDDVAFTLTATNIQMELGTTATAYQRVVSQYDVTESGVSSLHYLSFDGVDDWMQTGTITPGIDKAQVFAGLRKLSDSIGILVGHGPDTNGGPGRFEILSSGWNSPASRYGAGINITNLSRADSSANFAPPRADVILWQFDGAGSTTAEELIFRANGTAQTLSATDPPQGAGNFSEQQLYIGRRGGTTLPFNGNLYGLIVRFGANLSIYQITSAENWLAARTMPNSRWIDTPEPVPTIGAAHQGGFYYGQIWDELTTSASSVTISTGRQTFQVTNAAPLFYPGQAIKVVSRGDAGNRIMQGTVMQSYDNVLVVNVTSVTGSGTYADWSVLAKYRLIVAPKSSGEIFYHILQYKNEYTAAPAATQTLTNGAAATAAMVAAGTSTVYPLAHWADGLTIGGYTDWYVPARDEMELIWRNLKPVTNNNYAGDRSKSSIAYTSGGNQDDVSGDDHGVNRHSQPTGGAYTTSVPGQTSVTAFRSGNSEALYFGSTYYWTSSQDSAPTAWLAGYGTDFPGYQYIVLKTNFFGARAVRRSLV